MDTIDFHRAIFATGMVSCSAYLLRSKSVNTAKLLGVNTISFTKLRYKVRTMNIELTTH